ncbi:MAG: non-homologous end-joining DNA ligase [Patescibacteria group bacterium]
MKYSPMLCKLMKRPFDDKGWIFESKIDGVRIIAIKNGSKIKLLTRNNKDKAKQFPEIMATIGRLRPQKLVLDGELAAFRKGVSSFQAIQPRIGQTDPVIIAELVKTVPVRYIIFDLLESENNDLEHSPLLERKKKLKAILAAGQIDRQGNLVYLDYIARDGITFFKKAKQKKWEGIIGKKKDSFYKEGGRSGDWVKIKTHNQQEFVIGAYTPGQGKTKDTFGAVLVGYYRNNKLIYAGKVGTGFTDKERVELKKEFLKIKTTKVPFSKDPKEASALWLKPQLVGEFAFGEWTKGDILRQPVYMGLRIDKAPKSVIKEN